jgi:hypothetical protein
MDLEIHSRSDSYRYRADSHNELEIKENLKTVETVLVRICGSSLEANIGACSDNKAGTEK